MPILCGLAAVSGVPRQNQLANRFAGAWRLVSVEDNPPGLPGFFDRPAGMIGHTGAKAAAFDSYLANYGTFTVDEQAGTVTHHIEDYSVPGRRGSVNVRWFEFRGGDRLVLIPVENGKGGVIARKDATYKLFWERLK